MKQYAYQVIEDLAKGEIYFEITDNNKKYSFLKTDKLYWEMYLGGWHTINIYNQHIEYQSPSTDYYVIESCHKVLKDLVTNHVTQDEAYQIIADLRNP